MIQAEQIEALKTACPNFKDDSDPVAQEPHVETWRAGKVGKTPLILFPESAEEVAAALKICNQNRIPVFPQGGNTGLVHGSIPDETGNGIVINMARMNKIGEITSASTTVKVGAGVIVDNLKTAADEQDLLYPMEFGATGSAFIGGTVATNAGGANAIRYGVTRDLVVGITAVTPTGEIVKFGGTVKNTAGPQLQHLLIGGEGKFGIVTEIEVKLFPKPKKKEVALIALPTAEAAQKLLGVMKAGFGNEINSFEIMNRTSFELSMEKTGQKDPFDDKHAVYVLTEVTSQSEDADLEEKLGEVLFADEVEKAGIIADVLVSQNEGQQENLWKFRENISEASKEEANGRAVHFDTVVPVHNVAKFIEESKQKLAKAFPEAFASDPPMIKTVAFGHFGDGNVHFHVIQPKATHSTDFNLLDHKDRIEEIVLELAIRELGGSGWAEHGIGAKNIKLLEKFGDPAELALMAAVQRSFDPNGIMNPGRGIPEIAPQKAKSALERLDQERFGLGGDRGDQSGIRL